VRQARQLLAGEQRRFENGESQLLVVNLRERLVLDEALKLASLEAKYVAARAALAVALGQQGVP
jgi:outer membrane protein TolC